MKRALTLSFVFVGCLSVLSAGGEKKESPAAILKRFVGSWDIVVTNRPAGGEAVTYKASSKRTWDDVGPSVRFEDEQPNNRPPVYMTLRHDAEVGNYPMTVNMGDNSFQLVGTWNAQRSTMEFSGALPNGPDLTISHRFVNKTKAIVTAKITNAEGNEVGSLVFHQTRQKDGD